MTAQLEFAAGRALLWIGRQNLRCCDERLVLSLGRYLLSTYYVQDTVLGVWAYL